MADARKRQRKRRRCGKCGEIFSHSGYYKHVSHCDNVPEIQRMEHEEESDSDTFTIHSGASDSEAASSEDFRLDGCDRDLDIPVCVCEDNPGNIGQITL